MTADKKTDAINRATTAALRELVKGTETPEDLLIATEGLVAGVFLMVVKLGGEEPVLPVFARGVEERIRGARQAAAKKGN